MSEHRVNLILLLGLIPGVLERYPGPGYHSMSILVQHMITVYILPLTMNLSNLSVAGNGPANLDHFLI